jgi:hypothetical protein
MIVRIIAITEHYDSDEVGVYYDQRFVLSSAPDALLLDDGNFVGRVSRVEADAVVGAALRALGLGG